jgi:sugar/nucleoside kinase (ribokinase family)
LHRAIELAGKYATISVLSKGTQASYPHLKDLDNELKI